MTAQTVSILGGVAREGLGEERKDPLTPFSFFPSLVKSTLITDSLCDSVFL